MDGTYLTRRTRTRARFTREPADAARTALVEAPPAPIEDPRDAPAAVRARDHVYRRLLVIADIVAAACALLVCTEVVGDARLEPLGLLALPLTVLVSKVRGLYDRDELTIRKATLDEAPELFQLATLYTLVFWMLSGVFVDGELGADRALLLWASFFAFTVVARTAARTLGHRLAAPERCLFIGDAETYMRLLTKIDDPSSNAALVGRMSLQRIARRGARNAGEQELRDLMQWADAHRIIIEPQSLPPNDMLDLVRAAKSIGVRVSLLPRVFDVVGGSVVFDELGGVTVLGLRRFGLSRSAAALKRGFDLLGSGFALLVLAPVMAAVTVAIRLDSKGPVLFRQVRVGRDGRHFRIYKFRTMSTDAERRKAGLRAANEAVGLFKIEHDPRVTRVGRVLRRTSLDELPQLFNVLTGDMSLVGPRPLVCDEDSQIKGWDRRRLHLTPGMTGPWQVMGSKRVPLHEMVKIDYLYIAGWSLWQDLKIILRTVHFVVARRGM